MLPIDSERDGPIVEVLVPFPVPLLVDLEQIAGEQETNLAFLLLQHFSILKMLSDTSPNDMAQLLEDPTYGQGLQNWHQAAEEANERMQGYRDNPPGETMTRAVPLSEALRTDMENVEESLGGRKSAADFFIRAGFFARALRTTQSLS